MFSGYWIVPWGSVSKLPVRPGKILSLLALVFAARGREAIPSVVLVPGLDDLLRLGESVEAIAGLLRRTLAEAPTALWRGSVILMPVESIEQDAGWAIKIRRPDHPEVRVKSIFPRANLEVLGNLTLCYSPLVIVS